MGIAEPSSPLWTAVKAVHNSWPEDDEVVATSLATAWRRGGDLITKGAGDASRIGGELRTDWYDNAGAAFGGRINDMAAATDQVGKRMLTFEARAKHYADQLLSAKTTITDTISANEDAYAFLGNPVFGAVGAELQKWYANSIANDLRDMIAEKAQSLRDNPTGAPPPPAPPGRPGEDGWSLSDIGHAALDVIGLIPGLGEVADGANAAWYAAEGDYLNAGLSLAAMVPGLGVLAFGAKYADEAVALGADAASALTRGGDDLAALGAKTDAAPALSGAPPASALDAPPGAAPTPAAATPAATPDAPVPGGAANNAGPGGGSGASAPPGAGAASRPADPGATGTPVANRNTVDDPIDIASGEMVLHQEDLALPGVLPLVLTRTHISSYVAGQAFGPSWASTVDQRLEFDDDGAVLVADEGLLLVYPPVPADGAVLPVNGPRWPLRRAGDGYVVAKPELGQHLEFSGSRLSGWADRNGDRVDLLRDDDGTPREARHSGGYHVVFDSEGGLVTGMRLLTGGDSIQLARYRYEGARLVEVVNSSNLPLRFAYDDHGRITRWEDRNARWYSYTYDDHGRCVRNDGSDGFLAGRFAYHDGRTVFTDSLGARTTFELDDRRRVVREVDPLGNATASEWDEFDRLLSRTDPLGATTSYRYDEDGNLVTVLRPDGRPVRATYGPDRQPTSVTGPDGALWRREYDRRGNVLSVLDPQGARTTFAYDGRGHLVAVTDAAGATTRFVVNPAGLPVAVTDPLGATTQYTRDPLGRVRRIVDPLGGEVRLSWTVEGRLLRRASPDGAVERWRYDGEGNLTEYTDALGATTRTTYTAFDQPSVRTGADGARLELAYDTRLRLTSVTNPNGLVWRYEYDRAGRLAAETDFNGRRVVYAHDAAGRLAARTNALGETTTFRRDALGAVVEQRCDTGVTTFGYDAAGRLTHAENATAAVSLVRDRLGRVLAETVGDRTVTTTYDAVGRRLTRTTPSGARSVWSYDANDRPTALRSGGHTMRFDHDAAGREVRRALGAGWAERYAYDAAGNPTAAGDGPREYDGTLIRRAGTTTFRHDAQGRTVSRRRRTLSGQVREWRYTWDSDDRLVGVVTPDGTHWRYRYDPLGRRIAKQRLSCPDGPVAEQTDFTWDGAVLAEQTAGGATTTWDWAPTGIRPVAQLEQDEVDARFYAVVTDLVGTPSELVGPAGELVWHRRATLWGADADDRCPLRFPGQYHDPESGFDYNLFRHYDPETARYGSNDPLDLNGGPDPHAYVANPTRLIDPFGLAPCVYGTGGTINPKLVRFSQDEISPRFSSGHTVNETAAQLRSGYLDPTDLPHVRITVQDGDLYSLDNRRLAAFQKADVPMPFRMAMPDEAASEAWKFTTRNNGESIIINSRDPEVWKP